MVNKMMFWGGIVIIVISAILLLSGFMGDSTFPVFLGIIGIVLIGASGNRPLKIKNEEEKGKVKKPKGSIK